MLFENFKVFKSAQGGEQKQFNPEAEPDLSAMLKEEQEDFLKSLKKKHKQNNKDLKPVVVQDDNKMSDDEGDSGDEAEESGDPAESKAAFKVYMINVLTSNELDQKRAAKMEILDFLTLLNCFNKAGIHFK